ncbi:MAG: hypothetical protein ACFB15_22875, partial [Cyclobacteriaceae bacterium]
GIALPVTYLFFDRVILTNVAHHSPIGWGELLLGLAGVLIVALIMIGSQTIRAARLNPAQNLSDEYTIFATETPTTFLSMVLSPGTTPLH